jgi:hypothetical protein
MAEVIVKHDLRQRRSLKTPVQRRGGGGELEAMWACHGALGTTSCRASGGMGLVAGGKRKRLGRWRPIQSQTGWTSEPRLASITCAKVG